MEELVFHELYPGVWKYSAPDADPRRSLLQNAAARPAKSLSDAKPLPFPLEGVKGCRTQRGKNVLLFPFREDQRLYGLGLSYHSLCRNMGVFHLRTDHYAGRDNGRTHAPVPFYVSDQGYGVFVDSGEILSFYMGGHVRLDAKNPPPEMNRGRDADWACDQPSEYVEASFDGPAADVYVFAGESMTDVVARFNLLCGGGCLPPKWGLGMWDRLHIESSEAEVRRELENFRAHGMPLSVVGLEPGWQSNSYPCTQEWDRERFPDPAGLAGDLLKQGVRLNLWENMYISRKASYYDELKPYCGSHTVWGGAVPDLTVPEAEQILIRAHEKHLDAGIAGYKFDECDGYDVWLWPDHAEFPSGLSGEEMRQLFGLRIQRMADAMFRARGQRTYGLVRATNAGGSRFPYVIYNDCYSFEEFLTGLASSGFCGTLWVPEVRDADDAQEWVRRFQLSSVSPMLMLNAWSSGAKPWKFPEVEKLVREAILFRQALLPYLYTAFADYALRGIPPFRALCMDYSLRGTVSTGELDDTENPYTAMKISDLCSQFMIGQSLMAAPVYPGKTGRTVVLPEGDWYDFHTGEYVGSGAVLTLENVPLDTLPLYVRGGAMIPLHTEDGGLRVRCFGDSGSFTLYDDDGESYGYEDGAYALLRMEFSHAPDGSLRSSCREESFGGFHTSYRRVEFCKA